MASRCGSIPESALIDLRNALRLLRPTLVAAEAADEALIVNALLYATRKVIQVPDMTRAISTRPLSSAPARAVSRGSPPVRLVGFLGEIPRRSVPRCRE